jgi:hypothetical protein
LQLTSHMITATRSLNINPTPGTRFTGRLYQLSRLSIFSSPYSSCDWWGAWRIGSILILTTCFAFMPSHIVQCAEAMSAFETFEESPFEVLLARVAGWVHAFAKVLYGPKCCMSCKIVVPENNSISWESSLEVVNAYRSKVSGVARRRTSA